MKKRVALLLFLVVVMIALLIISIRNTTRIIYGPPVEEVVERLNTRLHNHEDLYMQGFGRIDSVYIESGDIVFQTNASPRYLNYDVIYWSRGELTRRIAYYSLSGFKADRSVLHAEMGMVCRFKWDDGRCIDVRFSPEDLRRGRDDVH